MVLKGHDKFPGAGSYELPSKIVEGPRSTMHGKTDTVDLNVKRGGPGPGSYELQNSPNFNHKTMPSFSVGNSQRSPLNADGKDGACKPGPGKYDGTTDLKKTAPIFSFGKQSRPDLARSPNQRSPGPGAYKEKEVIGKDGPSLTMSPKYPADQFKARNDKLVPGPGQYESHLKALKTSPKYRIGTA